jgi:ppGpp synthetase/RelA/SpoT-type nucleotidyltranferase
MKLFTKAIDQKLFKQYSKGSSINQDVIVKIFNPYGRGVWYILNSDPQDPDYLWAIVDLGNGAEMGSVSRKELENMRVKPFRLPLERDLGFYELPAKEVYDGVNQGKRFEEGGEVEGSENKEMLENQTQSIKHHVEELQKVLKSTKSVEPWVITKIQRATTDLADVTHYLEGEKGKYKKGGSLETNFTRGEEDDDYGTFELYKKGGRVDVKIVNDGQDFSKERYNWLSGDFDGDGLSNADDKNPNDSSVREPLDKPSLSGSLDFLLNLKESMDENMYSFVDDLKTVAPDKSKIYARTKTPYSILNKLVTKRLMNPKTGLTDLIGTTIVTSDKAELDKVKDAIGSGNMGKVIEFEDMYENPKQGYRAYHFLIERNGMPVEVQLKTKRQKAINELSHEPYKLKRLNAPKLLEISKIADEADRGNKASIKKYNDFFNKPDIENVFFLEAGGKLSQGGRTFAKGDEGMFNGGEVIVISADNNGYIVQSLDQDGKRTGSMMRVGKMTFEKLFKVFPKVDYEMVVEEYERNEDNNAHSENLVLLAETFGNNKDYELATKIVKRRDAEGSFPNDLYDAAKEMSDRLYPKYKEAKKNLQKEKQGMAKGGMTKKGGATFAEKVSAIKSKLKGTKVPSKLKKDYGKRYSSKEAEMAAKRIAGAMRKKEM